MMVLTKQAETTYRKLDEILIYLELEINLRQVEVKNKHTKGEINKLIKVLQEKRRNLK
mgnify:CR=1 FL=1|jgi:hypothetical protein